MNTPLFKAERIANRATYFGQIGHCITAKKVW